MPEPFILNRKDQVLAAEAAKVFKPKLKPQSYNVTPDELFDLFGKFGPIRYVYVWKDGPFGCSRAHGPYWVLTILTSTSQVRQGIANNSKGTAFVVYEDVMDAKQACDKLNGFNFQNRYLVGT